MIVGILGGGQLGMMLCQAARKLNLQTFIYTDSDDSPAIKKYFFGCDCNDLNQHKFQKLKFIQ